jgi:hypothetical protein
MPAKSDELWVAIAGREGPPPSLAAFDDLSLAGHRVRIGPVLFPKPPNAA